MASEEKVPSPELSVPARLPSTHAEHAATMAEVLRACVFAQSGRSPVSLQWSNFAAQRKTPRPPTQPT